MALLLNEFIKKLVGIYARACLEELNDVGKSELEKSVNTRVIRALF